VGSHQGKKSMAMSGLGCGKALVSTGRAIFVLYRDKLSDLVGPPFTAFKAMFFSYARLKFPKRLVSCPAVHVPQQRTSGAFT